MSDLLEDMSNNNEKENVQMKSGEITGDQHLFHSLPKEFQTWHTTYYILEKEGDLDSNAIAKAQLNAYLWKIILNATKYAIFSFFLIMHVVFVERIFNNPLITALDLTLFMTAAIYIGYQFYFFGIIRAQVIGHLTETMSKFTSIKYYQTYFSTLIALIIMVLFTLSFSADLLKLIFHLIVITSMEYSGEKMPFFTEVFFTFGIYLHNLIVLLIYQSDSILNNVYVMITGLTAILILIIIIIERIGFKGSRKEIIFEMARDILNKKYPIEKAQMVITAWRKKHGM